VSEVQLREFDWSGLVKARTFESFAFGIASTGIGLILLQASTTLPGWVLVHVGVSAACVFLGYLRAWKTAREEHETMDLWAAIDKSSDPNDVIVNRVFEFPYLFFISVLPFTSPLPQLFMVVLLCFYLVDNHYNSALARGIAGLTMGGTPADSLPARPGSDGWPGYARALARAMRRTVLMVGADGGRAAEGDSLARYFRTRFRYNRRLMGVLVVALAWTTAELVWHVALPVDAAAAAIAAILLITFVELVVEPYRNIGMSFTP
jgi:hypothetical protein